MNTLVFKSASMERLDSLLDKLIAEKKDDDRIDVLTHSHWGETIKANYPACNVINYPYSENFSRKSVLTLVSDETLLPEYDQVIVLLSNLTGKGHHNVLMAAEVFGKTVLSFNTNSEFSHISLLRIHTDNIKRATLFPFVISGTLLFWLVGGALLLPPLVLRSMRLALTNDRGLNK
ncbi:MAG: hypothetical protein OEY64_11995 [Nitrospinota bacterium]|nr:hypothetical protein [Nitrospinota bacterium]